MQVVSWLTTSRTKCMGHTRHRPSDHHLPLGTYLAGEDAGTVRVPARGCQVQRRLPRAVGGADHRPRPRRGPGDARTPPVGSGHERAEDPSMAVPASATEERVTRAFAHTHTTPRDTQA